MNNMFVFSELTPRIVVNSTLLRDATCAESSSIRCLWHLHTSDGLVHDFESDDDSESMRWLQVFLAHLPSCDL